ncbi:UNVERIFIED_CONTAM: F-box/FBD/LRR-repeat protein [Sesamum angustifolium]|uniref:F-box/FBD/LRR-repeat protein n=1 Tax=Sesamum angustifolium TaxID=2727405 RepID=A0AAW2L818_9LAMI
MLLVLNLQKQREPPELPCNLIVEVDRISNLPGHIIDKILSHLSLRDAVRTSILSTKWRYKWVTLPYLVFDNQSVLVSAPDQTLVKNKLYLAAGTIPGKLPKPCVDLSFLSIRINFNDIEENLAALCLLRSCPNLQELEMLARTEDQAPSRAATNIAENFQSFPFNQLRIVKIVGVSGIQQELYFINFLLANTPVLERMTVKPGSMDGGWELVKELLRFRRASMHAEIIYLDP